jgi:TPR repeat protein
LDVNVSKLPDCPEDTSSYWHNCFGTYTDDSEDKYVGEWKDNVQNGQGTAIWGPTSEFAGDKYVGEYKDGIRHGQGTYTWGPSSKWAGDKYVGEFKDSKITGQGTYTFSSGAEYVGEYKDGERHGQGTYTYADGTIEIGIWENDEFLYANNEEPKKQTIPPNAYASGSGWLCNSGYIKSGNKCVIKKISKTLKDGDNAYDKKDYKTALNIYRSLAEQGNAEAQFSLGWMYKKGKGVIKSLEEAIKWYTKAAEQGYGIAQYNLGIYYIDGEGIPIDYKKALSWWRKSAKQGYPHSEYALGWLYENGYGVKQDTKKALSWYLKADAQGNSKAKERIEELLLPQDGAPATADENSTEGYTFAGSGSGFVVSEDGVIATNNHVIDGCQKLIVDDLKATVISKDVQNDLALVKVNNKYKYVSTLSYKSPRLGDNINVFGYPLSDMFSDEHISLTKGSVSSLAGFEGDLSNFRFTAPVQPGNSGGPVVNEEGIVVGITKAVLGSKVLDELKFLPQNVNFGIRSNLLINMMESKLVDVISEPISESDFINHYSKATKFIKCYE